MERRIYQIRIEIAGVEPQIWRSIQIPSTVLLSDLHKIIQSTMGWKNSHQHQFTKGDTFYMPKRENDEEWGKFNEADYKDMVLGDLLAQEKDQVVYEYDFFDNWMHTVTLDAIIPDDRSTKYPNCLSGERKCPPEDCGGIAGFTELLKVMKMPEHPDYASYVEWLGCMYAPDYFYVEDVNILLQEENFGCN